ncbi:tRNA (5-methylaminomethyl-2-thiouridine)(34)-methyltransferase MnmD [Algimonas porphyrae]|uniref:tRNA 5-methylaminomethyl-2-thiouridine biosynthesis bifunctional protein MnmC n=1 Tax=Algimonas porphyrae TaxID=1128113 RepID=A0ABQ5V3B8_9PROT|nr:tRNA (5-methylaminomethyl-2-thiouridine)(34)-methyltransferase MnmD [Algimonas porphyrae]GLQ21580.1 tRNA 5-methylaminomethyl-2-thiouridine biosynthesis bifunctional protein MnmC [Algimonas porphyrae]
MPPPEPLTRTPAPSLDFSRPGTPAADDFGDIYFSTDGGLDETRAVFLTGCGLPDGWRDRDMFTIAELGFGSGLNFLATWQAWLDSGARGTLHYISVEGFPFAKSDLERALDHFPELADLSRRLIGGWPGPVRGIHRRHFGSVTLTLIHDAVASALASQRFHADAWFLDGFSPAKNPAMWSPDMMAEVARLSAPDARLATFTVAGAVRRALTEAGFKVERVAGFGRKRHRLEARRTETPTPRGNRPAAPTIIGAGIAGASIAQAFLRRGIVPTVLFDPDHPAASANPAALIKPRLDLQDQPASRFFLSSFLYAREAYKDAVLLEGITHRPKTDAEADRLQRIARQEPLGPGHLHWTGDSLDMPSALTIVPQAAREAMLAGVTPRPGRIDDLSALSGPLILASGYGVRSLLPDARFRFSRGQLSWTQGTLDRPVTYGGYAVPLDEHVDMRVLIGASHERITDHSQAFAVRDEDDAANLAQARSQGLDLGPSVQPLRTSVRVNTADTLPRLLCPDTEKAGENTKTDLWVLSGLGSRGFVFAPLLGEALVSAWLGEPSPLDAAVMDRLNRRPG